MAGKKRIALSMIVKNESKVIERCLNSVFQSGLVTYFKVIDTGSTDNTIDLITKCAINHNIKGTIESYPFTNFGDCRNKALEGLYDKFDWVLWIDAKEELIASRNAVKRIQSYIDDYDNDSFLIQTNSSNGAIDFRTNLFKLDGHTVWHGKCHEYLNVTKGELISGNEISITRHLDSESWDNKESLDKKYIKYEQLLKSQIREQPDEARWYYYLAETYRYFKTPETDEEAIKYYQKRIEMGDGLNWEERYLSVIMLAAIKFKKGISDFNLLKLVEGSQRPEHLILMAQMFNKNGNLVAAHRKMVLADKIIKSGNAATVGIDANLYCNFAPNFLSAIQLALDKDFDSQKM